MSEDKLEPQHFCIRPASGEKKKPAERKPVASYPRSSLRPTSDKCHTEKGVLGTVTSGLAKPTWHQWPHHLRTERSVWLTCMMSES